MVSSRRDVLRTMTALGGSGFAASVAGCMGAPSGSGGQQTEEPTETPAPTATPSPSPPQDAVAVEASDHPDLGRILVDGAGMTLYMFVPDEPNRSNCTGGCAEAWPPVVVGSADAVSAGMDVAADLDTTERSDGSLQVTANGMPLYYFVRDEAPGDATGQEAGNVWFVLRPDGSVLEPTVSVREVDALGSVLTDALGRTLYMFVPDDPDVSNCSGGCAEAWPPLVVEDEDALVESVKADVDLGTTERGDGSLQVTAGGMPLYYFVRDEEPGDATGQEAGNVWFVLRPDGSVLEPTVSVREHDDLGPILTDGLGRTLYMFTNDSPNESVCTGGCAEAWPPLTVAGEDAIVESVKADAALGTIERDDGSTQVTGGELPLYYYARDEGPGDATGQGVNDAWYVLTPDGSVVDSSDDGGSMNGGGGY